MAKRKTSREIEDAAASWAVRLDARGLTPAEHSELDVWLSADPRCVGAYAKARAVLTLTDKAKALRRGAEPPTSPPRQWSRRLLLGAGGVGALAAATSGVFVLRGAHYYRTPIGQVRVVTLEDGSVVTLNTQSELAVLFSPTARNLHLLQGEALFDVARDEARPFFVSAGDLRVQGASASFSVRRLAASAPEVLVREGVISVARRGAHESLHSVEANCRAQFVRAEAFAELQVSPVEVERELAWRDGRIAFEGQTLEEAAAQFARYSETRITFDDPSIAAEPVTGLFVSTDPVGFSRAIATAFNLDVEVGAGEVRLKRRAV